MECSSDNCGAERANRLRLVANPTTKGVTRCTDESVPFFYSCVKVGELVTMLCGVHVRVCSMCGFIKAEETVKLCILVNMLDPVCMRYRSAQKRWPEAGLIIPAHWLASGPDSFGQNLTRSAKTKLDLCWLWMNEWMKVYIKGIKNFHTKPCMFWLWKIWSGPSVEEYNWGWKLETGSWPLAFCQKQAWCLFVFVFVFCVMLYVNCFGRTMLYMCIEYHI